ncbi:14831_t:CDS:2, partial [Gigaspora margarita]
MVRYEITPQFLLPTSENFITIDPILSSTPNNTYVQELFCSSNTVTANSTPDVDDMDAYFDEP